MKIAYGAILANARSVTGAVCKCSELLVSILVLVARHHYKRPKIAVNAAIGMATVRMRADRHPEFPETERRGADGLFLSQSWWHSLQKNLVFPLRHASTVRFVCWALFLHLPQLKTLSGGRRRRPTSWDKTTTKMIAPTMYGANVSIAA